MLVWLAEHLVKYYSGFNVFSYLTFRAIVSLLTALFISLWMGPRMIARLQKLSFGQVVRNDGPESHFSKRGTPTMGGIMILTAIVVSVLLRQEFLLVIMGGVFVVETLSVILQVGSFKLRGQRIFRMAPIHHHYELKGWPEPRVIVRFWIISLMLVLIGLATLKVR